MRNNVGIANEVEKTLIANTIEVVTLSLATYDDKNNPIIIEFSISSSWLQEHIDSSIEEFLNEYTSEESEEIYALAILDNAIIAKHFSF